MPTFTSASHEDILLLLVRIAILLLAARTLGELAQRLNQPAVLGELFAGVLLGPSMLSGWFPIVHEWFIPQTNVQGYLLELMSLIGAMFLLLLTGLETEIELIKKHAKTAIYVAFGGLILPFISGFCFAYFLPESLLVSPDKKFIFAIFMATALSVSAIPVIAKVLIELKLMKREIGQIIVAAGVVDDTIAWIFLSIIASLTVNQTLDFLEVLKSVGSVLVFIIFSFTIGKWLVKKALDFVQDEVLSVDRLLTLIVVMTFLWGTFTQAIHLEPVLGAFVIGILFGQLKRLPKNVIEKLQSISMSIFVPIFFAVAGLKVNILGLLEPKLALISLAAILIATFSKIIGAYVGARFFAKADHWSSLTYGVGLNARGAMQIIIATIGLSLGILTQKMFSIIILVAIVTSLFAPLMLKFTVKRVKLTQEETKRLQKETLTEGSLVAKIHRILLPVRRRNEKGISKNQMLQAFILKRIEKKTELSVTLYNVSSTKTKKQSKQFLTDLSKFFTQKEVVPKIKISPTPFKTILEELQKDYDLLVLGASESKDELVFNSLINFLVRKSPCLTMIVKGTEIDETWSPKRILVPTNGTTAARQAAEFAFFISSAAKNEEVILLNIANIEQNDDERIKISNQIVHELSHLGEAFDAKATEKVVVSYQTEQSIISVSENENVDLIILGTHLRAGSAELFLGMKVEFILKNAKCPVIVVNSA